MQNDMGVIGLGVMGRNLALNIAHHGYSVAAYDLDKIKQNESTEAFEGQNARVYPDLGSFINSLNRPRRILMMVPAGKPVDAVIRDVSPHLENGDVLIDGGNSHFTDTESRFSQMNTKGILYMGMGVSGGEEGALNGPSLMPGGNPRAWPIMKPILQDIAAKVDEGATICCDWVGENGAGHFVKMVHNGIEYGDMQMICEAYQLMSQTLKMSAGEIADVFAEWNKGDLDSYLIEITSHILRKNDDITGQPMVDVIQDTAGQKGTGKWTSISALDLGIPTQTIAEAVFARFLSSMKAERVNAATILKAPEHIEIPDKVEFIDQIRQALYASKICSYAQGFQLMRAADARYSWHLNYGSIASLWRGGCIIRARFLTKIQDAFAADVNLANLLLAPYFVAEITNAQSAWRSVIAQAVLSGIAVPAFSSALSYFDSYRTARLPANLLQAQRDYFGAHTYERVDTAHGEYFHTDWTMPTD
ncbi:MAG: phosphogluconate dehydrogenase (NADP(+)-dependent, decarboxylating) [Candidatus Marinimicrobia bacterium CG_4_9_14_3_um_filter_48_9]|nr:MAG: phosphogluconate dehydrogenase (NADP(+)-dependent, decarboxylating) [Candidatus Marinimicrobia bacterium CG_4_9_14_3_um_filter_48_9]